MNTTAEFEREIARLEAVRDRYAASIREGRDRTGILGLALSDVKDSIKAVKVMKAQKAHDMRLRIYTSEKRALDLLTEAGLTNADLNWQRQCQKVNEAQDNMEWTAQLLRRAKNGL